MEMYYLVFALWYKGGAIVIPEKYQKEQCEQVGLDSRKEYFCVKAPKSWKCMTTIPGTNTAISTDCSVETGK
jgi:hypothetical protein